MSNIATSRFSLGSLRLRSEQHPYLVAAMLGLLLGLLGTLFALAFLTITRLVLPIEQWGDSAAAGLTKLREVALFFIAVVFAPVLETFVGQVIPIELARRVRASQFVCVILGGIVFGLGHYFNGGLVHGISTFFGGMVFSAGYVALRRAGACPAFVASSTAHAVQNGTLLFIIAPLFPGFA